MRLRPLHPAFGLEVTDIQLDATTPDAVIAELRRNLVQSEALLLRGQALSADEQRCLVERLSVGTISQTIPSLAVPGVETRPIAPDESDAFWQADRLWHELPSRLSVLHAQAISESQPAEILLLSQTQAYKALNPWLRWHIEYLEVEHRARRGARSETHSSATRHAHDALAQDTEAQIVHPLVRIDPATEKRSLFLPEATSHRLLDMPPQASAELLARLQQMLVNPNAIHRHIWQKGDLLIWDSARLLHKLLGLSADCALGFARSRPLGEKPIGPRSTAMPWVVAG